MLVTQYSSVLLMYISFIHHSFESFSISSFLSLCVFFFPKKYNLSVSESKNVGAEKKTKLKPKSNKSNKQIIICSPTDNRKCCEKKMS